MFENSNYTYVYVYIISLTPFSDSLYLRLSLSLSSVSCHKQKRISWKQQQFLNLFQHCLRLSFLRAKAFNFWLDWENTFTQIRKLSGIENIINWSQTNSLSWETTKWGCVRSENQNKCWKYAIYCPSLRVRERAPSWWVLCTQSAHPKKK